MVSILKWSNYKSIIVDNIFTIIINNIKLNTVAFTDGSTIHGAYRLLVVWERLYVTRSGRMVYRRE